MSALRAKDVINRLSPGEVPRGITVPPGRLIAATISLLVGLGELALALALGAWAAMANFDTAEARNWVFAAYPYLPTALPVDAYELAAHAQAYWWIVAGAAVVIFSMAASSLLAARRHLAGEPAAPRAVNPPAAPAPPAAPKPKPKSASRPPASKGARATPSPADQAAAVRKIVIAVVVLFFAAPFVLSVLAAIVLAVFGTL